MTPIRMMTSRLLSATLALIAVPAACHAQTQAPGGTPTFRIAVRLVQVHCSAVNRKSGGAMNITTPEQVRVYEDGKLVKARVRSGEDVPLTLGILIDTSSSQEEEYPRVKRQIHDFVAKIFRPGDRLFVATFAFTIHPLVNLTAPNESLESILHKIDSMVKQAGPQVFPPPKNLPGGTRVWDSIAVAAKAMANLEGRKAILDFTDGEDNNGFLTPDQALRVAQDTAVPVYGIGVEGAYSMTRKGSVSGSSFHSSGGSVPLVRVADLSGGHVYAETADIAMAKNLAELAETLRQQFVVEYRVPPDSPPGYHTIKVEPVDKSIEIHAKAGVWREKAPE